MKKLPEKGDGTCHRGPIGGPIGSAIVEVPDIGALWAGCSVVGAIPAVDEIGGGVDKESLTVVDG